jgi:hypothetical protein
MPAEHLRALIHERRPGVSVRQLTLAADLDPNRIAYYLKPGSNVTQIPALDALKDIARAIGCDVVDVAVAFAEDIGIPLGPPIDDPEVWQLVRLARRLGSADRATLLRVAESLGGGPAEVAAPPPRTVSAAVRPPPGRNTVPADRWGGVPLTPVRH